MKLVNGMEFINDEAVIGRWENIGWTEGADELSIHNLREKSGVFHTLYFLPNGEPYWIFEGWTKGTLLIYRGGDAPILAYRYDLRETDGGLYLFLRQEDKTEVFAKRDSRRYTMETLGKHDDVDLPFVPDERLVGKWNSVAFLEAGESFSLERLDAEKTNLYLRSIEAFSDGRLVQSYMDEEWQEKWTKGVILNLHRTTAAAYRIERIDGAEYLFLEWKMGNYIYGGYEPDCYVFRRA